MSSAAAAMDVVTTEHTPVSEVRTKGQNASSNGPFRIGQVIGAQYEIRSVLGVGGMNIVYEAYDRTLARTVALKAPLLDVYSSALAREAQALAALQSSSFVSIFSLGREGDVDFAVMERLFGDTLEHRLDECRRSARRMPIAEVIRILKGIANALSIAHMRGIAHRDLKPANVFLSGPHVVLVDLGIFVPEVLVSPENEVSGSPYYMAPEVILGEVTKGNGPRVDLYALGVIAFELLTNKTPFAGVPIHRTLMSHVSGRIPDVRDLRPEAPAALAALVAELVARDPKERCSSAESVVWQLSLLEYA